MRDRRLEILCALGAIWWGIWVGNPWWETFTLSTSYIWMARIAPEWVWGLVIGLSGVLQLGMASWNHSLELRIIMALISMLTWLLITVAFAFGNWHTTAVVIYGIFALMQALIYMENLIMWRLRRNGLHYE